MSKEKETKKLTTEDLPYTALGMFKHTKHKTWQLMVVKFDEDNNVLVDEVKNLHDDKNVARDMFKIEVIKRKVFPQ